MPVRVDTAQRDAIVDAICVYMHEHHRDRSIDDVLLSPAEALAMGLAVAAKVGRINKVAAKRVLSILSEINERDTHAVRGANDVCRIAMTTRKRGDLRKERF